MKKVSFYFDFLSPFSYLAIKQCQRLEGWFERQGVTIEYQPVSMIPLIKGWDTKGPAEIAPKRDFLFRQLSRKCQREGIPLRTPARLPFISLSLLRMATWAGQVYPDKQALLIQKLADAAWGQGGDMEDQDLLQHCWTQSGLPLSAWAEIEERSVRKLLQEKMRQQLASAQEHKLFGVPTWVYNGELFWGADSLTDLQMAITGEDLLDRAEYQRYLQIVTPPAQAPNQEWQ